ncbi:MAG: TIM-barrel domain-containing protein [Gemmatimonadota bacterium]
MASPITRRDALRQLGIAGAGLMFAGTIRGQSSAPIMVAGMPVEIEVWSLSPGTVRLTVRPLVNGELQAVSTTGALAEDRPGTLMARGPDSTAVQRVTAGDLVVRYSEGPPTLHVETSQGAVVQTLVLSAMNPGMSFLLGDGPLLGFGEGGSQFDRRGAVDNMRNGQGARSEGAGPYSLSTHGTRAPVQWLIATQNGWAMFIHQPYGAFDLTGERGTFTPAEGTPLPLDVFVISSNDPKAIMGEWAKITGLPEMPALWTFGYVQSSRTLAGPEEILGIARTFRDKELPCDTLVYLGTDFAPSGWNTRNGEFTWHEGNFPDPKAMIDELHALNFKVVVHIVIEGRTLTGSVHDACTAEPLPSGRTEDNRWPPDRQVACYWPVHKQVMDVGVDGWWPDQGDGFDGPSRFNRHRMYWEGTQLYRPNVRPFALHRNASPGIQRFGGFIWTGDPRAFWVTLQNHVPVGINTGLSGFPYWGSDIGGFNPTEEYTAELHTRWFQFGAFCPSFRAHGRNWHLKLPWGWGGGPQGEGGPFEAGDWRADPADLRRPEIEQIQKKFLEVRYRLMPYLYTAVREAHETGLPIIRALWLHYPEDRVASARGDEYLYGRDILVAPVVEQGATNRRLYLPRGGWYDFWTEERVEGGREIDRAVDLSIMPLYVRAGAVLPIGPVKQYVEEQVNAPLSLVVFPGASDTSHLYEDDGISFDHRNGEFMRLSLAWDDAGRRLTIELEPGSRMLPPAPRPLEVRLAGQASGRVVSFDGSPLTVQL